MSKDHIRNQLPFLRTLLHQLVLLDSGLLAGGAAFPVVAPGFQITALVCFLLSLLAALWGLMPLSLKMELSQPLSMFDTWDVVIDHKSLCATLAAWLIFAGFSVVLVGLAWKAFA